MADGCLRGIRVIEFGPLIALPATGRLLGALGAEVIKVETNRALDNFCFLPGWNPGLAAPELQMAKKRITLDPQRPEAKPIWERLLKISDVFMTNFRRRILDRWGIDFPEIRRINPDIIILWQTAMGSNGPYGVYKLFGTFTQHMCGISAMTGFANSTPGVANTSYSDYHCSGFEALALIGALERRRRTGRPSLIECSILKAGALTVGPTALDFQVNGRMPGQMGNRHPAACPHGVYPCQGEDRWCAIAVFTEAQWRSLCAVLDRPHLLCDMRFATLASRLMNQDELDRLIAEATSTRSASELMVGLQREAVPAGIVARGEDLAESAHLQQRGFFTQTPYYKADRQKRGIEWELGPDTVAANIPIRFSATPCELNPMRRVGEDNEYVYGELLKMSPQEIRRLAENEVIV